MVSSSHEAMHRLFREKPEVFAHTLRSLGLPFSDPVRATLLPNEVTEVSPVERQVDTLLRFDTDGPEGSFLLVVEAQGKKDLKKHASWAYYLSFLYSKYELPPVLLVVCQDRNTAAWAAQPVDIGPPQWAGLTLRPLVVGPHNLPFITDPAVASEDVPLATLSAIAHGRSRDAGAILKALAAALKTVDDDDASILMELTEQGLGTAPAAAIWRNLMAVDLSFFRSETAQKLRTEGRTEGLAEGRNEGLAEGRTEGLAEALLLVLGKREIAVPDEARARITSCTDHDILTTWMMRALTVTTVDDLFRAE